MQKTLLMVLFISLMAMGCRSKPQYRQKPIEVMLSTSPSLPQQREKSGPEGLIDMSQALEATLVQIENKSHEAAKANEMLVQHMHYFGYMRREDLLEAIEQQKIGAFFADLESSLVLYDVAKLLKLWDLLHQKKGGG